MKSGRENGLENLNKDGKVLIWILKRVIWVQARYFGTEIFGGAAGIYGSELCDTGEEKVIEPRWSRN